MWDVVPMPSERIGERFTDFQIACSSVGWSEWFQCPAWDGTWILTDKRNEHVTVICITDTD